MPLLAARGLVAGYDQKVVLRSIDIDVSESEVVAVIGHNGAGKSTLLNAVFGMIPLSEGRVFVDGVEIGKPSPRVLRSRGVVMVPQGHRVFDSLSVMENLLIAGSRAALHARDESLEYVMLHFPWLKQNIRRRAGTLSGGERQLLALASSFMAAPRLLLLDEPLLGLSPGMASRVIADIVSAVQTRKLAALIVEQRVASVLSIADRAYVLRRGRVAFCGGASELADEQRLRQLFL